MDRTLSRRIRVPSYGHDAPTVSPEHGHGGRGRRRTQGRGSRGKELVVPGPRRLGVLFALVLVAAGMSVMIPSTPAAAAPCDPPVTNAVACENTLPGSPESEWGI